ncbi:hypothetical protein [Belliella pelovolcani]|uniref:hypothetical protein n=1 Tax=Belliella pelovolcani TaxID=529505 RepID=UPI0039195057
MKTELQSIIKDFNYEKALKWYLQHVQGKFFIKEMLQKGEDPFNVLKLKKELNLVLDSLPDLIQKLNPIPDQDQSLDDEVPKGNLKPKIKVVDFAAKSRDELIVDDEWKTLYKEAAYYHTQLDHITDPIERRDAAFKILDLMDEVEKLWAKRDFIQQYGQLPTFEDHGIESLDPRQMSKRISTVRTYISKARKGKLNAEKIPTWEAEIQELERRLQSEPI